MNEALLGKWVWRMLKDNKDDLCYTLLKNKYFQNKSFVHFEGNMRSQFRKGWLRSEKV
jgi:hypothetical protein